jgi:hypothetical protein
LRTTASPTRRPATNATVPEPGATNTTTRSPWNARPVDTTRPTSALLVAPLRRQSGPALGPAAGEDRATRAGPHPDPEAVALGSPAVVRLVRPLRHRSASCPRGSHRDRSRRPRRSTESRLERPAATEYSRWAVSMSRGPSRARKCAKRPSSTSRVENSGAIFRRAPPPGPVPPTGRFCPSPQISTHVERLCG